MEEEGGDHAPGHAGDHVAHLQPHVQQPRGATAVAHPRSLKTVTNWPENGSVYSVSLVTRAMPGFKFHHIYRQVCTILFPNIHSLPCLCQCFMRQSIQVNLKSKQMTHQHSFSILIDFPQSRAIFSLSLSQDRVRIRMFSGTEIRTLENQNLGRESMA